MYERKVFVSDELIREKAKQIQTLYNEQNPEDLRVDLKFNNGWLEKLKARSRFKNYKSHGESGNVDLKVINSELPKLQEKLRSYSLNDIWNADEFGLFYQLPPTQTIAQAPIPGRKRKKKRITCLVCANADGSEKMPRLVIGK